MKKIYFSLLTILLSFAFTSSFAIVGPILGAGSICAGSTLALSDTTAGGTWSSNNTLVATISSTGLVTTHTAGMVIISYTVPVKGYVTTSIMVSPLPHAYTLSGGGDYCVPGTGVDVYLTGSDMGNDYYLYFGGMPMGLTIPGSGSNIHFGMQTMPGTYTAIAVDATTGCTNTMSGSVTVTMDTVSTVISMHNIVIVPDTACKGSDFYLYICGPSTSSFKVKTNYGDGTSDTSSVVRGANHVYHNYSSYGTYSVKQVLYDGTTPKDSIAFSNEYVFCNTFPVRLYFDYNHNCSMDAGEDVFTYPVSVEIDSAGLKIHEMSVTSGFYYKAYGPVGTVYSFKVLSMPPGQYISCPATAILYDTVRSYVNNYPTRYFGIDCIGPSGSFDLSESVTTRTGRHANDGTIIVKNSYCYGAHAIVKLTFSNKYAFSFSSPSPTTLVSNVATWDLGIVSSSLPVPVISYYLEVPGSWLLPGDTVQTTVVVTSTTGTDVDTLNNYYSSTDTVRSSFDPNDIKVVPETRIIPCTELQYAIRFENTGNDTAHNISVMDTLSNSLEPDSMKIVVSSAMMNTSVVRDGGYNIIRFDFPNINLLDSSHHGQCDGLVIYKIKTKAGLVDGTAINNYAGIFFDDNPAVMTNTATNITGIDPINGPANVCNGNSILLTDVSAKGVWSNSNTSATVTGGTVTGTAAGTTIISYTVSNSCTSRAATKTITVDPVALPAVAVASSSKYGDTVCSGELVTLTANITDGGSLPKYVWTLNGITAGTGGSFTYAPTTGDIIVITLTSNAPCAVPSTATSTTTITVTAPTVPTVYLTVDPGLYIAEGSSATFTANVTDGGAAPSFQWVVNSTILAGETAATYTTSMLNENDSVSCIVTNNDLCGYGTFNSVFVHKYPADVNMLNGGNEAAIFPNPSSGIIMVKNAAGSQLVITDMVGKQILSRLVSTGMQTVNISQLPSGVYTAQLINAAGVKTNIKVVKE